jgi:hypothetical protein
MENKNKSAFPVFGGFDGGDPRNMILGGGLTKREYFAVMSMQGLVQRDGWTERLNNEQGDNTLLKDIATASIKMADELLKQLES